MTTVSPSWTLSWRCRPVASRPNTAVGSPCEPVAITVTRWAGSLLTSEMSMSKSGGSSR